MIKSQTVVEKQTLKVEKIKKRKSHRGSTGNIDLN
jgi:hypothetical protein